MGESFTYLEGEGIAMGSIGSGIASETATGTAAAGRRSTGALVLLATVQLMVVLDVTIVNVALPSIQTGLHFSLSGLAWVVNGYALTFGALLLVGGRSGDILGRRHVFVASVGAFAAASTLAGISSGTAMLVVARIAQGSSAAFAQATALSLIVSTFEAGPARNRAVGVFAAMEGLGAALGLVLGGALVSGISWRWVFFVNVPVAAVVAILAPRLIPSPTLQRARFDLPGAGTATSGLALLVFACSRAADHGWSDAGTISALAVGVLLLIGFVLIEGRVSQPLVPLWVFQDRNRAGAYIVQALTGAALFGMFFLSTLFLQHVRHYSALKAGLAFAPATLIMMVAAGAVSKLVAHTGVRPLVAAGSAIGAVGMLLLGNLTPHSTYLTGVMLPMMLLTSGLGLVVVPATLAAVSGTTEQYSGLVSGVSTTAIQVGGSIGVAVLATIATTFTNGQPAGTPIAQAVTAGYTHAFRIGAIIIALAVPVALTLLRLRPGADGPPAMSIQPGPGPTRAGGAADGPSLDTPLV